MKDPFLELCQTLETENTLKEEYTTSMLQSLSDFTAILSRAVLNQADDEVAKQIEEVTNRIDHIKNITTSRYFAIYFSGGGPIASTIRNYSMLSAVMCSEAVNAEQLQTNINKFVYKVENDKVVYDQISTLIKNLVILDLNTFIPDDFYVNLPFEHNRINGYSESMVIKSVFNGEVIKELLLYKKLDNGIIISFTYYINKMEWNENKVWYYHPYENRWLLTYPGTGLVGGIEILTTEFKLLLNKYVNQAFDFDEAKVKLDSLAEYVFMQSNGINKLITLAVTNADPTDINTVCIMPMEDEVVIRIPIRNSEISNPSATGYAVNYVKTTGEYPSTHCIITHKQNGNSFSISTPIADLTPLAKKVIAAETEQALNYLIKALTSKEFKQLGKKEFTTH